MKRGLLSLTIILVAFLPGLYAAEFTVENLTLAAGQTGQLVVGMNNTETNLSGFQFKLSLPEGVILTKNSKGKFIFTLSERIEYHTLSITELADGNYQFICYSMDADLINGNNGELLSISVTAEETFSGQGEGELSNIVVTDVDTHTSNCNNVSFTVGQPMAYATGISLSNTTLNLTAAGQTATLTATVTPSNATNKNVTWTSSNTAVATVGSTGVVTAVSNGSAVITATTADGTNLSAECSVTVSIPGLNNIIFDDENVKALCVANWDTNNDGELSTDEAAVVTGLGTVFQNNTQITSFDELSYFTGLTSIGSQAFNGCTGLTSITIPKNVTSIGSDAFKDCIGLTRAEFASIEDLCGMAFENVNSNPLYKAHHLFINGEEITELVIPNSVTSIGNYAFMGCSSLTSATIPNSVTEIGSNIFNRCTALASVSLPENLTKISDGMFYECKNLASVIIPEGVTSIGRCAFQESGLTSIVIPNSVTTIGIQAFNVCYSLTSLSIGSGLKDLTNGYFFMCQNLTKVEFASIEDLCNINFDGQKMNNPLFYAHHLYINGEEVTDLVIPNSVTQIGVMTFINCSSITSVTIPESVTEIDSSAFSGCNGITTVKMYKETPLSNCPFTSRAEATLYVPVGCKAAYEAADYWKEFKEIIEMSSFITFADANVKAICVQNWDTNGDGELSEDEAAAVTSLGVVFKGNTEITSFNELQYFTGLTEIPRQAFMSCSNLISVVIPDNITQIGYSAFDDCYALASINLPSTITNIDGAAFSDCRSLTSITLPEGIPSIGDWFFDNCTGLTEVIIPESVTTIGQNAFSGCIALNSIRIPNGVSSIGYGAFSNCPNVTSIVVAEGNTTYDSRNNCNAIIETATNKLIKGCINTVIPSDVTSIGNAAFYYCFGLTSISLPEGLTSIESSAFRSCTALTEITIPASVTSIGSYAFEECTSLTSVTVLILTPVTISSDVFSNRANATLTVPFPTKYLYEAVDYWKEFKEIVQMEGPVAIGDTFPAPVPCDEAMTNLTFKVTNVSPLEVEVMSSPEDIAGAVTIPAMVAYHGLQFAVKGIGEEAFMDRTLSSVQLPSGLETIRSKAFYHSGLESIKFPSTLKEVYNNAFGECTSLQSIDFNHCSAFFSYQCFIACRALEEVNIPNTVKFRNGDGTWSWGTFEHCTSLKNVVFEPFEDEQTQWTSTTFFSNCSALETVVLPSNSVMQKAFFNNCTALRSVTYLELQDDFNPQTSSFDKMYNGLNPNLIQFTVPEGKAELMLKGGYLLLSDLSGMPLVREQFEDEANRIATMAEGFADGDKQTLATAISNARLAVNAAEDYSTVYEQIDGIKSAAMAYIKTATMGNEIDVTSAYVVNPDFNRLQLKWNSTGDWTTWPNVHKRGWSEDHYENGDVTIDKFFEIWEGSNSLADNTISQTIKDLPAGNYRVEADIIATNQSDANAEVTGVSLFANSSKTAVATENEKPQHFSVEFTQYEDGDCTIGVDVTNTNANWVAMDNVRLYRLGGEVPAAVVDADETYYLQNVETGKFLNQGNRWGTHAVLKDKGLPLRITRFADGSYTFYFLQGSANEHLLFRDDATHVYVDYSSSRENQCPYWTITATDVEGVYHIQSLITDSRYGQQVYPGTYLGNNPTKEAVNHDGTHLGVYNDVDGDITDTEGMNLKWRFVNQDHMDALSIVEDLEKLIGYARAAGTDVSAAEAVANNVNASSEEVTAAIGELRTAYLSKLNEGVSENLLPLDVSGLIVNADFDHNDSHGWTNSETEGTDGKSVRAGEQAYEFWNTAFDFHQTLSGLPNGNYLLKMKGFHRTETYEGTTQKSQYGEPTAVLYANGESQVLRSILDGMTEGNLGDDWPVDDEGTTYYVPKDMADVAARFERDMYWNEVPVTVTNGELTIGVKLDNYTNNCWVMFDEFRLILLQQDYIGGIEGDVNKDQSVTIADVTALVNILSGNGNMEYDYDAADVDGKDGITEEDVTALINMILNQ